MSGLSRLAKSGEQESAKRRLNRGVPSVSAPTERSEKIAGQPEQSKAESRLTEMFAPEPRVTVQPTSVSAPLVTSSQQPEVAHESTPRLRATLTQLLMEIPSDARGSTVYGDSEKEELAPIALKILDVMTQIKQIDPSVDLRSVAQETQSPDGYYDLSPLVEAIENGSLGIDIQNYWASIRDPVNYQPVLGERSMDFNRRIAEIADNPNVKVLNVVGLVTNQSLSDNPLKEGGNDVEDKHKSESKEDESYSFWDGSVIDQKRKYSLADGYSTAKPKGLNGIDAKVTRQRSKLQTEQKRIELLRLKDAYLRAIQTEKLLKSQRRQQRAKPKVAKQQSIFKE